MILYSPTSVHVNTQQEINSIPEDYDGQIIIDTYEEHAVSIKQNFCKYMSIKIINDSVVYISSDNNFKITVCDNSIVNIQGNSTVKAYNNAIVHAFDKIKVDAFDESKIYAYDYTVVNAYDNSRVDASDSSKVYAHGNSMVFCDEQDKDVCAQHCFQDKAKSINCIKSIESYLNFYNIKHKNGKAILYKAVCKTKTENTFLSYFDPDFSYKIGEIITEKCDKDVTKECSYGIHLSPLWFAVSYGRRVYYNSTIIECEVDINDIVVPINTNGKVRVSEAKVLKEIARLI